MSAISTLLCIHRDPSQLSLLKQNGYELLTAATSREGLRLFMSRDVDAIVIDYHLGLLDGAIVAAEIKQVRPQVPIVMLANPLELPPEALNSVDAVVPRSAAPQSLWAAVHFVLNMEPRKNFVSTAKLRSRQKHRWGAAGRSRNGRSKLEPFVQADETAAFSADLWQRIFNGTVQF
jgi:CheY-like chemotaxis protein